MCRIDCESHWSLWPYRNTTGVSTSILPQGPSRAWRISFTCSRASMKQRGSIEGRDTRCNDPEALYAVAVFDWRAPIAYCGREIPPQFFTKQRRLACLPAMRFALRLFAKLRRASAANQNLAACELCRTANLHGVLYKERATSVRRSGSLQAGHGIRKQWWNRACVTGTLRNRALAQLGGSRVSRRLRRSAEMLVVGKASFLCPSKTLMRWYSPPTNVFASVFQEM